MKNIEIESKYVINEKIYNIIETYFNEKGYDCKVENQYDIYFSPLFTPFFGGKINNEALRIRVLNDKNILNYKKFIDKTEKSDAYNIEHEMEIEDISMFKQILKDLRIEEAFTLIKKRKKYIVEDMIEVSLDEVKDLGYFIEIEIISSENKLDKALELRDKLIKEFGLKEEMRSYKGYGYMLYELNNNS